MQKAKNEQDGIIRIYNLHIFQKLTAEIKNYIFQYGPCLIESMSDVGTGQTRLQRKPTAQRTKTTHQLPEEPDKEIENGPILLKFYKVTRN